jgi:hypothetical protein
MAPGRRAFVAPAQVVERSALDAQELGSLVDGEKGRVVILDHDVASGGFVSPV